MNGETSAPIAARQILLAAVFFALLTGLGEAAILLVLMLQFDVYVGVGPHMVWMSPVVQLLLFAIPTVLLLLVHRLRPWAVTLRVVVGVYVFLAVVSVLFLHQKIHAVAIALLGLGLAVAAGRLVVSHRARFFWLIRRVTVAAVALVVLLACAVEGGLVVSERRELAALPAALSGAPNVLFIILDTVRALNLSVYGYARATSPNLDRLAQRGVVFDRAMATASWTMPSHASMFTGRWPYELVVGRKEQLLPLKVPTIAEVLRDHGYYTAGFVANPRVSRISGLAAGMIHHEDFDHSFGMFLQSSALVRKVASKKWFRRLTGYYQPLVRKNAREINEDFLAWLPSAEKRPFFAFINYMDAHAPYLPPPPFDTLFHRGVRGRRPPLGEELNVARQPADFVDIEVAAYDGSIAYLDNQLGRLFAELDRRGVLQNTLIIISADHGEELGERGEFGHGHSQRLEILHVPLIIVPPGGARTMPRVSQPVSLRSVPSTVLEVTGVRTNVRFPGRSLAVHWRSPKSTDVEFADTVLAQVRGTISAFAGRYHYFRDNTGRPFLYDHQADLLEETNLASVPAYQTVVDSLRTFAGRIAPTPLP
ncbi:MAG: sulfatase [Gemmatimonadaceae bacterium]